MIQISRLPIVTFQQCCEPFLAVPFLQLIFSHMLLFAFIIFEAADGPGLVCHWHFDMGSDSAIYHWELPAGLLAFAF